MTSTWKLIDTLIADDPAKLWALPRAIMAELAERVEEALGRATSDELRSLLDQVQRLVDGAIASAPAEAVAAARGSTTATDVSEAAYRLGQLGFVQLLAAQALARRTDADFIALLKDPNMLPLVRALYAREQRGVDLAKTLELTVETVSRKLQELRAAGITHFRGQSDGRINFLTPAAQFVVETERLLDREELPPLTTAARRWVEERREEQEPHMRHSQSFAREFDTSDE